MNGIPIMCKFNGVLKAIKHREICKYNLRENACKELIIRKPWRTNRDVQQCFSAHTNKSLYCYKQTISPKVKLSDNNYINYDF